MKPDHDEFTCLDCERLIWSVPPREPPPTRCAMCQWLIEFVADPAERAEIRRREFQ